jgi:hypothetical protein
MAIGFIRERNLAHTIEQVGGMDSEYGQVIIIAASRLTYWISVELC